MEDTIILLESEQEFKPYAELTHANQIFINNIQLKRDGWRYSCLGAVLISTFRVEGLVNQIGTMNIPFWKEIEMSSWRKKIETLCAELQIPLDFKKRPFRTIADLFSFRNDVVHAYSGATSKSGLCAYGSVESSRRRWPESRWESICNLKFAQKCNYDIEVIAKMLCDKTSMNWDDFTSLGCLCSIDPE